MTNTNWWLENATDDMQGAFALRVVGHSTELNDDDEICTVFCNDINIEERVGNAILIKNLPDAYTLLNSLADRMTKAEKAVYEGIMKEVQKGYQF